MHSSTENKITISVNMDRNKGSEENKQKRERRSKKMIDFNPVSVHNKKQDELPLPKMNSNDPILESRISG